MAAGADVGTAAAGDVIDGFRKRVTGRQRSTGGKTFVGGDAERIVKRLRVAGLVAQSTREVRIHGAGIRAANSQIRSVVRIHPAAGIDALQLVALRRQKDGAVGTNDRSRVEIDLIAAIEMIGARADIGESRVPAARQLGLDFHVITVNHGAAEILVIHDLRLQGEALQDSICIWKRVGQRISAGIFARGVEVGAHGFFVIGRRGFLLADDVRKNLVVIDAKAGANHRIPAASERPAKPKPWRKIFNRRIVVQIRAYRSLFGCPGIHNENALAILVVDERREFITEAKIDAEIRAQGERIVAVETKQGLTPELTIGRTGQDAHQVGALGAALQETIQTVEGPVAGAIGIRESVRVITMDLSAELQRVKPALKDHIVGKLQGIENGGRGATAARAEAADARNGKLAKIGSVRNEK